MVKRFDYSKSNMISKDIEKYVKFNPTEHNDGIITQEEMREDFKQYKFLKENFYIGYKHFGGVEAFGLNNSKLHLRFGCKFWMYDNSFIETQGLEPDIYFACATHQDALKTMKNFIKNNLNQTHSKVSKNKEYEKI